MGDIVRMQRRPYAQRQFIALRDEHWRARHSAFQVGKGAVIAVGFGAAGSAVYWTARAWRRRGIHVTNLSLTEVTGLQFPPGHPLTDTVYVGHPCNPNMYYPMAQFHRLLLEDKVASAFLLLMRIGAREVEVEHLEGQSTTVQGQAQLSTFVEETTARLGATMQKGSGIILRARVKSSVAEPERETPTMEALSEEIRWLPYEPLWQSFVRARLDRNIDEMALEMRSETDYGVLAELGDRMMKFKLGLGGKFERHQTTNLRLLARF